MHARKLVLATVVAAVCAAAFFAGYAWAFQTYYCGSSSSYCTMTESGSGTASTAIRTDNNIHCYYTTCHSDDWYQNSGGTITKIHSSAGAQDNYIGSSDGIYVYSWCGTSIGYGSNTARCWTDW